MNVITITEEAFFELVEQVVRRLQGQENTTKPRWISDTEAMELLGIKSKSTLQQFRDSGSITFSKVRHKVILYDRQSIEHYISRQAHNAFNNGR
ncbi:helix-turn-helix domain-containing protein [Dyadobacter sp. CY261]|uniref:helix-turn-helix domain-containing protein n=1 Tax=Dyadobacter sp. CY261 TaxID=2907203 RepID=UPI001F44E1B1|nr:helix-turn-helix domain-containing protein [Dyadobacter sp. CY261]MCF0072447.1 helix-turn-helix domain-containing protein [Dyadobacter sp. CY261]